jgi:predicted phosphodiesterase
LSVLIGVISDTHNLLRPQVLAALKGSALILHAGDVCRPEVLEELSGSRRSSRFAATTTAEAGQADFSRPGRST